MSAFAFPPESLNHGQEEVEISTASQIQTPLHQNMCVAQGPVAILWDIENCRVPSGVRAEDVARNIRLALRVHPVIDGTVKMFSAYGDFNGFPKRVREGCQRTGVKLVDVPNGRKDAADKAILIDMFLFALDNRPPSCIMLISGDVDFAPALHILGQRGYTIFLVIPSSVAVSSALINGGRFVWDWPTVARGEGYWPRARTLIPPRAETSQNSMVYPANGTKRFVWDSPSVACGEGFCSPAQTLIPPRAETSGNSMGYLANGTGRFIWDSLSVARGEDFSLPAQTLIPPRTEASGHSMGYLANGTGRFGWDSPSVAQGEGFCCPPAQTLIPPRAENSGNLMGCLANGNTDDQNEEESIVYQGILKSNDTMRDCLIPSQSPSERRNNSTSIPQNPSFGRSNNPPSTSKKVRSKTFTSEKKGSTSSHPEGLNGLKIELENLLVLFGGILPMAHLTEEYSKLYGRPLDVSNYGAPKLVKLLKKMPDAISVEGRNQKKIVRLRVTKPGPINTPVILARKVNGKKQSPENDINETAGVGSTDELSDYEKGILHTGEDREETIRLNVDKFKFELQEILVSYSYQILLNSFEPIYQQRYKRKLDYAIFGVNQLEELLERVGDVVVVQEEPVNKQKFLVAVSG